MNNQKSSIITHFEHSISWGNNLRSLSENQWRTPIAEDKWTIAEVIGHLIPWDEFVIHERISYFYTNRECPKSPNSDEVNKQASIIAKRRSKEETITAFISVRQELISEIKKLDDELWNKRFTIGKSSLTLFDYFSGLIEHDEHHFQQIKEVFSN